MQAVYVVKYASVLSGKIVIRSKVPHREEVIDIFVVAVYLVHRNFANMANTAT